VAKKSRRKDEDRARKTSAKDDRKLLQLGEDLLTAVHLHRAIQEDEVRAALASAHGDLAQAAGDLVARIAGRFLEESGADTGRRDRYARWARAEPEPVSPAAVAAEELGPEEDGLVPPH
jgi:hypothetical protein